MTAFVIPNGIQVTTRTGRFTFASFITRDTSFDVIHNIWRLSRPRTARSNSIRSESLDTSANGTSVNGTSLNGTGTVPHSPGANGAASHQAHRKPTECGCGKRGEHYDKTMMDCVMPGTPAQIHTLMWTSGFIKDFMVNTAKLTGMFNCFLSQSRLDTMELISQYVLRHPDVRLGAAKGRLTSPWSYTLVY